MKKKISKKTTKSKIRTQVKHPVKAVKKAAAKKTVAAKKTAKAVDRIARAPAFGKPPSGPRVVPEAKLPRQDSEVVQEGVTITLRGPDLKLRAMHGDACAAAGIVSITGAIDVPCSFDAPTTLTFESEKQAAEFASAQFVAVDLASPGYIVDGDDTYWNIAEIRAQEAEAYAPHGDESGDEEETATDAEEETATDAEESDTPASKATTA